MVASRAWVVRVVVAPPAGVFWFGAGSDEHGGGEGVASFLAGGVAPDGTVGEEPFGELVEVEGLAAGGAGEEEQVGGQLEQRTAGVHAGQLHHGQLLGQRVDVVDVERGQGETACLLRVCGSGLRAGSVSRACGRQPGLSVRRLRCVTRAGVRRWSAGTSRWVLPTRRWLSTGSRWLIGATYWSFVGGGRGAQRLPASRSVAEVRQPITRTAHGGLAAPVRW